LERREAAEAVRAQAEAARAHDEAARAQAEAARAQAEADRAQAEAKAKAEAKAAHVRAEQADLLQQLRNRISTGLENGASDDVLDTLLADVKLTHDYLYVLRADSDLDPPPPKPPPTKPPPMGADGKDTTHQPWTFEWLRENQ